MTSLWLLNKSNAIYRDDIDKVQGFLKDDADPNFCAGESGWIDSNPLAVVASGFYSIFWARRVGYVISDPPVDVKIFNLLIGAGANINSRPYVWQRIYILSNRNIENILDSGKSNNKPNNEIQEEIKDLVDGADRILRCFLEAGADPGMLGHPVPYKYDPRMNDQKAKEYFAQGTRPINGPYPI